MRCYRAAITAGISPDEIRLDIGDAVDVGLYLNGMMIFEPSELGPYKYDAVPARLDIDWRSPILFERESDGFRIRFQRPSLRIRKIEARPAGEVPDGRCFRFEDEGRTLVLFSKNRQDGDCISAIWMTQ